MTSYIAHTAPDTGPPADPSPRGHRKLKLVRGFLGLEAVAFLAASAVHRGWLFSGYEHGKAAVAETVIALVLAAGLAATWLMPRRPLVPGWIAQGFAILGTAVGIVMVIIGVGPQTVPDIIYHGIIMAVLLAGAAAFARN